MIPGLIFKMCLGLAGRFSGKSASAPAVGCGAARAWFRTRVVLLVLLLAPASGLALAPVQGDQVVNRARLASAGIIPVDAAVAVTVVIRTPSTLELFIHAPLLPEALPVHVSPTAYRSGSAGTDPFVDMPAPRPLGATLPLDLSRPVPLTATSQIHQGEPFFIRLTDKDQNLDTTLAESVCVRVDNPASNDVEILRLTETGANTGVFTGYLATANSPATLYNGNLAIAEGQLLTADYIDLQDNSDTSTSTLIVDPYGIVFDSNNGQPVNGATITLIDAATGLAVKGLGSDGSEKSGVLPQRSDLFTPATVFGDDGVSSFPATLTSGAPVSDSSGRTYAFPAGGYRFPFVLPGSYQLRITPPPGYAAPSTIATATLQTLPGGPFTIVPGSRGEVLVVNPGPVLHVDIPLDPAPAALWLQKSTDKVVAGQGDFIPYRLTLASAGTAGALTRVRVIDTLPPGFRLRSGSVRINAAAAGDPAVSADGRTLTFSLGTLESPATVLIDYVVEVTAGARLGAARNRAYADSAQGGRSNTAEATVTIQDDFLRSRSTLMGRVTTGACDAESGEGADAVAGVRIYLEDGSFVISDQQGLFHFEGVRPGLHVVQLDLASLPDGYEAFACTENSRFAGRSFSQFVETQGGTLWRTDFHLRAPVNAVAAPPPERVNEASPLVQSSPPAQEAPIESLPMADIVLRPHFPVLGDELAADDRKHLDALAGLLTDLAVERIEITGHTDNQPIAQRSQGIHRDNQALSMARARSVGRYLMSRLPYPEERFVLSGKGAMLPLADNRSEAGRARNRRVVVRIIFQHLDNPAALQALKALGSEPPVEALAASSAPPAATAAPVEPPVTIPEEQGILAPQAQEILLHPINGVRVCLDSGLTPRLLVDDREVATDRIGFTMQDERAEKTIYSYIGVDFGGPGVHQLRFQGIDPLGNVRFEQTLPVSRSGEIVSIRLKSAEGNVADGTSPVRLQLELYDAAGTRIPAGAELEIRSGTLRPLNEPDLFAAPPLVGSFAHLPLSPEGELLFAPVSSSGLYRVVLGYNAVTLEVEIYVQPQLRDWILVGLAEGTIGYNTAAGKMESLPSTAMAEDLYEDGRVALFAKGQIQGKWLLTMAYDTAKNRDDNTGLFQTINPETYYTLYGDATRQQYDAASSKKLYLRIEREQFYAMFGDIDSGLTVTELSRYSRRMTGVRSELQSDRVEVNAFASESEQAYVRDEIAGNGTSGIYRLSRRKIVPNSEVLTIEIRDRFRSEILLSSRTLGRFVDYSIDYDSGAVIFKEPVYSRDSQFNPVTIVAEYETVMTGDQDYFYGGRAGVKLLAERLKIGASHIHEAEGERSSNLYGVDTTVMLDASTRLRAEFAASDTDTGGTERSGTAYLAEVSHSSRILDGKAYYREQGTGFGLGQQPGSEAGTRKYGLDGTCRFAEHFSTSETIYRQDNLLTTATRDVAEARLHYTEPRHGASFGLLHAQDRLETGSDRTSDQVTLGGKILTLDDRLTLTLDHAQSIGSNSNSDFPTRTALGAEYTVSRSLTLLAAQELTWGKDAVTRNSRLGMRATPWQGAALTSSVEQQFNENDERIFANVGLRQTWQLDAAWKLDAGLERSQTLARSGNYRLNSNVPPASGGSEDFTAVSTGATYQVKQLTWDNRLEYRYAESERKWGVMSGLVKEVDSRWAWSGRTRIFQTSATGGIETTKADLRYGLVFRPPQSPWIFLNRLDYLVDRQIGGAAVDTSSWRLVNNLIANVHPRKELQVSLQYGAKYVRETINDRDYSGFTDHIGFETRYDLTKRWDLGVRGSLLHSWHGGRYDYSFGPSTGCKVVDNAWVSIGYNLRGFADSDFSRADYTMQGVYVRFRMKFDQESVKDGATWLNRQ